MRSRFICILILYHFTAAAQQYYETYSPANGLVDARVNRILQDGKGRLLFLTRDGLSIFDGQRFINHTRIGSQNIGIINDGYLLPDGSIELTGFSGTWLTCRPDRNNPDTSTSTTIPEVSTILPISGHERLIVSNLGIFHVKDNQQPEKLNLPALADNRRPVIEKIALSGRQVVFNYFLKNDSLIYVYDLASGRITDSLIVPDIYNIVADEDHRIFICTVKGLIQLNTVLLQQGKLKTEASWFASFIPPGFTVYNLFFDHRRFPWLIGNSNGCVNIDLLHNKTINYTAENGLLSGVRSMFQDNENNYWFIAPGMGVQKLMQTNYEIVSRIGELAVTSVASFNFTSDPGIFINDGSHLLLFKTNELINVPENLQASKDPFFYWQKDWWQLKDGKTIRGTKQTINIATDAQLNNKQHFPSLSMNTGKEGEFLISGNHFTIVKKNLTAITQPLPYFADNVAEDEENRYWTFSRSNDVSVFTLKDNQLLLAESFNTPGIEPRYLLHWQKDTFWIATRYRGIVIATIRDKKVKVLSQLDRAQGLSNDFAETILRISSNRVAIGTASGLDIITIDGNDTLIENISARINHFEPVLQLCKDHNGIVYARTENLQLFRYDPASGDSSGFTPSAWFSNININGLPVSTAEHHFHHSRNNFSFSVSAPSFTDNKNIVFRFLLTNEEKEWKQFSTKPDFSINNLPPGHYRLEATIKYPGRIYPDKHLIYTFTIRPPFWKTWWFITLLIATILLSAYSLARSYFNRRLQRQQMIMEKELAIEQERTRMARELHDGLGSMLSGIKHSFAAMKNRLQLSEKEDLVFHSNIDKLNESILELRNISHSMASESLLKYGLESSLADYCRNINQQGHPYISFNAIGTDKMKLKEEQSFHIFRIVQELMQNCIKHAGASQVILQLSYNENRLYITVEDDGKGFEMADTMNKGMGLKNIETRVRILHGKMDYQTAVQKGTSVLIEIPCEVKNRDQII